MPLVFGVLNEVAGAERRVAVVPDVLKKFANLGVEFLIEGGAGLAAGIRDDDFAPAGMVAPGSDWLGRAQLILRVRPPTLAEIGSLPAGSVLAGFLAPYADAERVRALAERKITSFAMELVPRISRAQSMDALSSQAAVSGYCCALIAANHCPKFFPMLTYAAGTIRPAQVLVIGAGVAGLQAIATVKRMGAVVTGYDVRPETREQIESLGAKFVDTGVSAAGSGGYARELTDAEKAQQAERLGRAVAATDVLITTAAIPGKRAPVIVSADMVAAMRQGAVVVDMAAETGGNVAGTVAGETLTIGGVTLIGPVNLPSRLAVHASEMYAKNLYNFLAPFVRDGTLALDWDDEVLAGACLTHAGEVRHAGVRQALGL